MNRVAITGIGLIAPGGSSPVEFFRGLIAGQSQIREIDGLDFERLAGPIAAPAFLESTTYFAAPKLRMLDRVSQFALVAARQAVTAAGLQAPDFGGDRCGVFMGTGMGGAQTTDDGYRTVYAQQSDRVKPFTVLMAMNNAPAAWIAIELGLTGPCLTYSTACSSSAVAIGEAALRIASGQADVMLAGGAEAPLTFGTLKAWEALHTLATPDKDDVSASCKPFSENRSGMVLGEGAAVVVLEQWEHAVARGANILAEFAGYGLATDIAHLTKPTVVGQAAAMKRALVAAQLQPHDIHYINAHGTGTVANDAVETLAIKDVFGYSAPQIPVSSTKSMHGHLLGAAGALEFIVALEALRLRQLPPTMHLHRSDPVCDLDFIPNRARNVEKIDAVMSNSFAFGGTNAVLIARRVHDEI
ncbi:MAG: beta-ketoacyl-[acyl-carrier-protein] synthase family protein [Pseudomonadota bacterium]